MRIYVDPAIWLSIYGICLIIAIMALVAEKGKSPHGGSNTAEREERKNTIKRVTEKGGKVK